MKSSENLENKYNLKLGKINQKKREVFKVG